MFWVDGFAMVVRWAREFWWGGQLTVLASLLSDHVKWSNFLTQLGLERRIYQSQLEGIEIDLERPA